MYKENINHRRIFFFMIIQVDHVIRVGGTLTIFYHNSLEFKKKISVHYTISKILLTLQKKNV